MKWLPEKSINPTTKLILAEVHVCEVNDFSFTYLWDPKGKEAFFDRYELKAHIDALLIFTQYLRKELRCRSIEFEAKTNGVKVL